MQTQADTTTFQFAYTLDAQGRVEQVDLTNPRGNVRHVTYDPASGYLLTDPLGHTTTFTRDNLGNVTAISDPLSHQTTFTYSGGGRLLTVTTPAGTTTFNYDGGDLVGITDPLGRTTTRFIDSLGRLVRTTNPPTDHEGYTITKVGGPRSGAVVIEHPSTR